MQRKILALTVSLSALAVGLPAIALDKPAPKDSASSENQIPDIIVTAQKREENIQKVPVTITAFSGDTLQARGIKSIAELATITPGLQVDVQNGFVLPFLRGIGNAGAAVGNESSIAVYVDGVYYTSLPAGVFSLGSISRVEVLKGPQGTLFGRNASGGVIQLLTKDPSQETEVSGSLSHGNYSTTEGTLYATTGLAKDLAINISISGRRQANGYGRNIVTGYRNGYLDYFTARSKLVYEPSDATKITLSGTYGYSKTSIQANTFPGTTQGTITAPFQQYGPLGFYDRRDNYEGFGRDDMWAVSLKVEQDISFAKLTSTTAYVHTKFFSDIDPDWGPRLDFHVPQHAFINQFTQEIQISSLPQSPIKWVAGFFFYDTKQAFTPAEFRETIFTNPFGDGFDAYSSQVAKSYAGYGQASYEIVPRLTLTGGLRYTADNTHATGAFVPGGLAPTPADYFPQHATTRKLTYKAAVDYQIADDVLGYFSYGRGYKSLAYNLLVYDGSHNEPEVLDSFEAGLKSELFYKRVRINLAAFYYKVKNPQVQLIRAGSIVLSNADSSRVKGADLDITAKLFNGFTVHISGTYLDPKYKVYGLLDSTGACTIRCAPSGRPDANHPLTPYGYGSVAPLYSIQAGGNYLSYAPKLSGDVGFDYVVKTGSGDFTFSGDYYYNSGYFFEPDNYLHQGRFGLFNGQIKYAPTEHLNVAVWGKNLANKKYISYAGAQAGAAGFPFTGAPPRTYGLSVGYDF